MNEPTEKEILLRIRRDSDVRSLETERKLKTRFDDDAEKTFIDCMVYEIMDFKEGAEIAPKSDGYITHYIKQRKYHQKILNNALKENMKQYEKNITKLNTRITKYNQELSELEAIRIRKHLLTLEKNQGNS